MWRIQCTTWHSASSRGVLLDRGLWKEAKLACLVVLATAWSATQILQISHTIIVHSACLATPSALLSIAPKTPLRSNQWLTTCLVVALTTLRTSTWDLFSTIVEPVLVPIQAYLLPLLFTSCKKPSLLLAPSLSQISRLKQLFTLGRAITSSFFALGTMWTDSVWRSTVTSRATLTSVSSFSKSLSIQIISLYRSWQWSVATVHL